MGDEGKWCRLGISIECLGDSLFCEHPSPSSYLPPPSSLLFSSPEYQPRYRYDHRSLTRGATDVLDVNAALWSACSGKRSIGGGKWWSRSFDTGACNDDGRSLFWGRCPNAYSSRVPTYFEVSRIEWFVTIRAGQVMKQGIKRKECSDPMETGAKLGRWRGQAGQI